MMKHLMIPIVLLFSFCAKAQNQDTIPKHYENFFGSDCDQDTLILKSVRNSEIVFYKNEGRLMRVKNGKVKWERDLSSLFAERRNEQCCLLQRGVEGKPRKTFILIVFVSDEKSDNLTIRSVNGKVVSKSTRKIKDNLRKKI